MGLISVSQCSQLFFNDKIFTVHTGGKGIAGCFKDAGQIPDLRYLGATFSHPFLTRTVLHNPIKKHFLAGKLLLEQHPGLAGQAGLSVGHGAVVWVQGCVDGSSQVLGRGAPCSAAHGDPRSLQRLCCAGADGSELQGQHFHSACSGTQNHLSSVSSAPLTSSG